MDFEDKKLLCPRCLSNGDYNVMKKVKKHTIVVDKCKKCGGLFLDKDEQQHIIKELKKTK